MDTVTQIALGAAIGEGGFRKKLGGKAVAIGALCGLFPDLDFPVGYWGDWAYLVHHRGFSHSLIFLLIVTPLMGALGYWWSKKRASWKDWSHLSAWALFTHVFLDVCTSYGTLLLWPFSWHRFSIDAVAIIDPFYSLPLLLAVFFSLLPKIRTFSRRFALVALFLTTSYLALGYIQSRRAVALARSQLQSSSFQPVRIQPSPTLFNIGVWRIIAFDKKGNTRVGFVSTFFPRTISFHKIPRPSHPLIQKTLSHRRGKIFQWFARDLITVEVKKKKGGTVIDLHDQRYGLITTPLDTVFNARARYDSQGKLMTFTLYRRQSDPEVEKELRALWNLFWGK